MLRNHQEGIIGENHIFTKVSNYLIVTNWLKIIELSFIFIFLPKNVTFILIK